MRATERGASGIPMVAAGVGLGAALMYALDPVAGRRRRALARDKAVHAGHKLRDSTDATAHDVGNRMAGWAARLRSTVATDMPEDDVLTARVRSVLGRVASHPRSLEVTVGEGLVTLAGPVLADDVDHVLAAVRRVRGVRDVESLLDVREERADESGLQGGALRPGRYPEIWQAQWSPAMRLAAASTGVALGAYGRRRGGLVGATSSLVGGGLALRAITNLELRRLLGVRAGRRAVDVQKTIYLDAPIDRVFAFWEEVDNFPHFMTGVRAVRKLGNRRSHWVVAGPAGAEIQWDAETTRYEPPHLLAWRSVEGAPIAHAGYVRFEPEETARTRVTVSLHYNPPGGALGHAVATAFGVDPKHQLDQDLLRMKTLIEVGRPPRDAAAPAS
ncbi:MAG: BON domain-containing protein [Luteitalea sp.]|nr:BON domain-containing protein [Luteitalea sp.]